MNYHQLFYQISVDLRISEHTGSNEGDPGHVNNSFIGDEDNVKDGSNVEYRREKATDPKALGRDQDDDDSDGTRHRAPVSGGSSRSISIILVLVLVVSLKYISSPTSKYLSRTI